MSALKKLPPPDMTVDEFLAWSATVGGRWQLRDGVPEMMDPAADAHNGIQGELIYLLIAHLRQIGGSCRVVPAPGTVPGLRPKRNLLILDIGVTCAPPTRGVPVPDPVILIELLSASNQKQTRANCVAFRTIPTVAEIVLVSSMRIGAELWRRGPDGSWPDDPEKLGPTDRLVLQSIGFSENLRDAYRTTIFAHHG